MNASPAINSILPERTSLTFENGRLTNICRETIYELIRDIKDPEHPYTLEQLNVISLENIFIGTIKAEEGVPSAGLPIKYIKILFQPTIPHCSMASVIGLSIKMQLTKYLNDYFIIVNIIEDTHVNWIALNKQLDDKERVQAAMENEALLNVIEDCIEIFKEKYF